MQIIFCNLKDMENFSEVFKAYNEYIEKFNDQKADKEYSDKYKLEQYYPFLRSPYNLTYAYHSHRDHRLPVLFLPNGEPALHFYLHNLPQKYIKLKKFIKFLSEKNINIQEKGIKLNGHPHPKPHAYLAVSTLMDSLNLQINSKQKMLYFKGRHIIVEISRSKIKSKTNNYEASSSDQTIINSRITSTNNISILELNLDCLCEIFSYLSSTDKIILGLTCQYFKSFFDINSLIIDNSAEKYNINYYEELLSESTKIYQFNTIKLKNYVLQDLPFPILSFLKGNTWLLEYLQCLDLSGVKIPSNAIQNFIPNFQSLQDLTIGDTSGPCDEQLGKLFQNDKFMKNLKLFGVHNNIYFRGKCLLENTIKCLIDDEIAFVTESKFINITTLTIWYCLKINLRFIQEFLIKNQTVTTLRLEAISTICNVNIQDIFLGLHLTNIEQFLWVDNSHGALIMNFMNLYENPIINKKLKELTLMSIRENNSYDVWEALNILFSSVLTHLKSLTMADIDFEDYLLVMNYLTRLECLILKDLKNINSYLWTTQFSSLKYLSIQLQSFSCSDLCVFIDNNLETLETIEIFHTELTELQSFINYISNIKIRFDQTIDLLVDKKVYENITEEMKQTSIQNNSPIAIKCNETDQPLYKVTEKLPLPDKRYKRIM